ncbi:hypothetical protein Pcinc_031814, partial [Petrolisthes cinctipes]
ELQEEVTSLLEFRENVLAALPHLHSRPNPSSLTNTNTINNTNTPTIISSANTPTTTTTSSTIPHDPPIARPAAPRCSPTKVHPHQVTEGGGGGGGVGAGGPGRERVGGGGSGGGGSNKSLSETHNSAVADSGFSTDKAGGSMGKSSSSSAAEHLSSGGEDTRWTSVEPDLPLGSAEDELWQLLDVIQRKGTRLRHDLDRAERLERERLVHPAPPTTPSPASDPLVHHMSQPHPGYRDAWPHSLPGPLGHHYPSRTHLLPPPPPPPPPMGVALEAEAWAAVERLRQDRQYLAGRVSWAEAEAAASHQRLLDLHTQLVALAGDKRRLEDQVRALCLHTTTTTTTQHQHHQHHTLDHNTHTSDDRTHSHTHPKDVHLQFVKSNGVRDGAGALAAAGEWAALVGGTGGALEDPQSVARHQGGGINTNNNRPIRSASSVRLNTDRGEVILPRVLKVPIKDRTPRAKDRDNENNNNNSNKEEEQGGVGTRGSDRVVIERERRPGRADGGWSMPVSLLKGGAKVKVPPNKQRISAILREKDVIELQRQLLTTVMEAEVLRKQVETAGEEWENKAGEWEAQHRASLATITSLRDQNHALKSKVDIGGVSRQEVSVTAKPVMSEVSTMTDHVEGRKEHDDDDDDDEEEASHRVHPGPNVKYDVVIHQDPPRRDSTTTSQHQQQQHHPSPHTRRDLVQNSAPRRDVSSSSSTQSQQNSPPRQDHPTPPRKAGLAGVEKPPRRTREVRSAPSPGTHSSHRDSPTGDNHGVGRDSLGRGGNGTRLRPSLSHSGRGTPTGTPRSSPAPSITTRLCGSRGSTGPQESGRTTPLGRSSSNTNNNNTTTLTRSSILSRRESVKSSNNNSSSAKTASAKTSTSTTTSTSTAGVGQNKGCGMVVCPPPPPTSSTSSSSSSSSTSSTSSSSSSTSACTVAERRSMQSSGLLSCNCGGWLVVVIVVVSWLVGGDCGSCNCGGWLVVVIVVVSWLVGGGDCGGWLVVIVVVVVVNGSSSRSGEQGSVSSRRWSTVTGRPSPTPTPTHSPHHQHHRRRTPSPTHSSPHHHRRHTTTPSPSPTPTHSPHHHTPSSPHHHQHHQHTPSSQHRHTTPSSPQHYHHQHRRTPSPLALSDLCSSSPDTSPTPPPLQQQHTPSHHHHHHQRYSSPLTSSHLVSSSFSSSYRPSSPLPLTSSHRPSSPLPLSSSQLVSSSASSPPNTSSRPQDKRMGMRSETANRKRLIFANINNNNTPPLGYSRESVGSSGSSREFVGNSRGILDSQEDEEEEEEEAQNIGCESKNAEWYGDDKEEEKEERYLKNNNPRSEQHTYHHNQQQEHYEEQDDDDEQQDDDDEQEEGDEVDDVLLPLSSSTSCSSFYDSINTEDVNNRLMQVEVAFEWSPIPAPLEWTRAPVHAPFEAGRVPVPAPMEWIRPPVPAPAPMEWSGPPVLPTPDIRYLPPAAPHVWAPTHHTICPGKRIPPVTQPPNWSTAPKVPNVGHRGTMRAPVSDVYGGGEYMNLMTHTTTTASGGDSVVDYMRAIQNMNTNHMYVGDARRLITSGDTGTLKRTPSNVTRTTTTHTNSRNTGETLYSGDIDGGRKDGDRNRNREMNRVTRDVQQPWPIDSLEDNENEVEEKRYHEEVLATAAGVVGVGRGGVVVGGYDGLTGGRRRVSRMRGGAMNGGGALRVKSVDRPSVLSMVQEVPTERAAVHSPSSDTNTEPEFITNTTTNTSPSVYRPRPPGSPSPRPLPHTPQRQTSDPITPGRLHSDPDTPQKSTSDPDTPRRLHSDPDTPQRLVIDPNTPQRSTTDPNTPQRLQFRHRRPVGGVRESGTSSSSALSTDGDLNSRVHQILARIAASAQ